MTTAKENMRVHVFSPDQKEDWGFGTIEKVENIEITEDGKIVEVWDIDYPSKIKLDNGKMTEGMKCWWRPKEENL